MNPQDRTFLSVYLKCTVWKSSFICFVSYIFFLQELSETFDHIRSAGIDISFWLTIVQQENTRYMFSSFTSGKYNGWENFISKLDLIRGYGFPTQIIKVVAEMSLGSKKP